LVYPVARNVGKRERLRRIVAGIEHQAGNPKVFVLAGFGDSYCTNGPLLEFIAKQSLPAGAPMAVFCDGSGPSPPEYKGLNSARNRT
jgi:hypothetical protein